MATETGVYSNSVCRKVWKTRRGRQMPLLPMFLEMIPPSESVVDIGAGKGKYVRALKEKGYNVHGVDGTQNIERQTGGLIKKFDLVTDDIDSDEFLRCADWGLFIEVGEHIPAEFEDHIIGNVCLMPRRSLIVSWAIPGQRGHGHVNCRTPEWVAAKFALSGWMIDEAATVQCRKLSGRHYKNRIMVLRSEQ